MAALNANQKRLVAVLLLAGGYAGGKQVQRVIKKAQASQKCIASDLTSERQNSSQAKVGGRVAVDRRFFRRLATILSICVPSLLCWEAWLILLQGGLLVSRTLLTDYISRLEGYCGRHLVGLNFPAFGRAVAAFAAVGVPAALVNAGLKFMQKRIELAFQQRLTTTLHKRYTQNRAYYAASTLGGLTHADQRITEDVEKFAYSISELYGHTFKPLLDVVLFTRSLSRVMGYKGQFALYGYYLAAAALLRAISPPLSAMCAAEAGLSGAFRAAHQRLVAYSEEVAFNDPPGGIAEQLILNRHLRRLVDFTKLSALQRFVQQVADGYFVKYLASCVALLVYAGPIYFADPAARGSQGQLTEDYIRSMRLLQNTNRGVGDLVLVYKRITALAAHTSRVSELLEQVGQLSAEDEEHRELFRRNVSVAHGLGPTDADPGELPAPQRLTGDRIAFRAVALDSPDGTPLIRGLTFEVTVGRSVMLMGPNGCGKSSLFRVLAGLWPLQAGEVTCPPKSQVFYLSQRPYLVSGSLRDQLRYPRPPAAVWAAATLQERETFRGTVAALSDESEECSSSGVCSVGQEAGDDSDHLAACLRAVELEYLLARGKGWEQVQAWNETLSGGEKQRLAMARLLYHRPRFAVLDECTSAVSADGEVRLYQACQAAGITFLSIGHRPALKRFHQLVVHVDGTVGQTGKGWWLEELTADAPAVANGAH